jgi:hypothetical protein
LTLIQRNFKFVSIVGFVTILQATWVRITSVQNGHIRRWRANDSLSTCSTPLTQLPKLTRAGSNVHRECTLLANWPGLLNGGTAGIIWCTIAVWFFMMALIASIAEMASMAPNSGGQYHWVSNFQTAFPIE